MNILIRGAGFQNKGAEAMLRVVQRELSKRIADLSINATVTPAEAPFAYRSGIVPLYYEPSMRMKLLRAIPFASKIPEFLISKKNPYFAKAIKFHTAAAYEINIAGNVDAVIDVSGFSYSDSWGVGSFKYAWPWVEYCQSQNKPYFFLPQAWGPFEKPDVSYWAKKLCNSDAIIISRDDESTRHLADLQGVAIQEIRQYPDIGFGFSGSPESYGKSIIEGLGLGRGRPIVGIAPNMRVYERSSGKGSGNNYVRLLSFLVDYCITKLGTDVLLIPNELKVSGYVSPDDRFLCGIVASNVQNGEHCRSIRDYYTSEALKSVLGQIDMLIASRFHSLVFALSQGVPSVALGWSHKYKELLRPFGLEKYVVDHDQLNDSEVISLIEDVWKSKEEMRARINETADLLRVQTETLFDDLVSRLK